MMIKLIYLLLLLPLASSLNVQAKVPSTEERKAIIECHTKLRENVQPPATNMRLMEYSLEMEKLAEGSLTYWEEPFQESDPEYQNVGIVTMSSQDVRPKFHDLCRVNSTSFSPKKNSCNGDCHNYRQMVWATSTEVGCIEATCNTKKGLGKSTHLLLCMYKPSDLNYDDNPYEPGPSCSKCPDGYGCHRNQCSSDPILGQSTTSISTILSPIFILQSAIFLTSCLI
uniref:SCP domain-containing protein n=1 Tax=Mesocestoides corti TaxID=53468 RepID=A0A5K3FMN4_MESCO